MLKLQVESPLTLHELATETRLKESTIRYYLKAVLNEYIERTFGEIGTSQGKKAAYPPEILYRLLFIEHLKHELGASTKHRIKPSTKQLRRWMNNLSDEQIQRVLSGEESLEFGIPKFDKGERIIETLKGERLPADSKKYGEQVSSYKVSDTKEDTTAIVRNSASKYIEGALKDRTQEASVMYSLSPSSEATWQTIRLGPDLEIRHKLNLTKSQKKQLMLTSELLKELLSKEK